MIVPTHIACYTLRQGSEYLPVGHLRFQSPLRLISPVACSLLHDWFGSPRVISEISHGLEPQKALQGALHWTWRGDPPPISGSPLPWNGHSCCGIRSSCHSRCTASNGLSQGQVSSQWCLHIHLVSQRNLSKQAREESCPISYRRSH